ncbi:MAG: alpha/beta hydrolase [Cryomorphaceae bacterium]
MPNIRFKDINLYFHEKGKGSAVVLLHGFLEASWMWEDIATALSKRYRVVCIDLPGHGKSDCLGYVHSMDEMAEAVMAVVRSLRLRRVHLVGHSMGGYVALAFAERWPDHLKGLILYHSTARSDSPSKKKDRNRVIELVKRNHASFVRQSIPMLFRPLNRKRMREGVNHVKKQALQTSVQGTIAALAGMRDRPNRELLLKFPPYPVHIIAGEMDPRIPLQESTELAEISEHVHLQIIRGCGHMGYLEAPNESLEALRTALN